MANFESTMTRNLQCPICLSLLTDPKQLSCTHTFCKPCLQRLLFSKSASDSISCPVCRRTTNVANGEVSNLPTNVPLKAIVSDVKAVGQQCRACDEGPKAIHYCCDCDQMLCIDCRVVHDKWKPNANHKLVSAADIREGKVVPKRKVCCKEHKPDEDKQKCTDVCITCKKYICMRCRLLEHEKKGHVVKSDVDYLDSLSADANTLKENAAEKVTTMKKHIDFIKAQKRKVIQHIDELSDSIIRAHDEVTRRLNKEKEILLRQCKTEKEQFCRDLDSMTNKVDRIVTSIESVSDLAVKSCATPIDEDTIAIRESFCDELQAVLKVAIPLNSSVLKITSSAEKLNYESEQSIGKVGLGKLKYSTWKVRTDIALSTVNNMNCMVATPDGRMAVGCIYGQRGIEIYSADGQLQQTVLKGKPVRAMGFFSDGRCVVRDANNNNAVSVYTHGWEKLDVKFDTLSLDEGGLGDLTVHNDDHIYTSYVKAKKIQVFTPAGGKPVREIQCDGYVPQQIFTMQSRKMLVVRDFTNSALLIDSESGCEHHNVVKVKGMSVFPALREDDSILIATVNKDRDRVTIEHYTSELKHVSTLITDHVIEKTERGWCYLQEFSSGEIAFCTTDSLYIFYQLVKLPGV